MERPPADPAKLLSAWADWETGEVPAGRTMSNMKTGGLRDVIEHLASEPTEVTPDASDLTALLATWTEWEVGATSPEPVMLGLQGAGLRPLLEALAGAVPVQAPESGDLGG
ncbi:hypothetical protein [Iamia sp.]|uniref:hypothetical protein n=1 Tax=Iamia sp. TaxID=2722710 RepID=UPI002D067D98|nr:hypothetical protein [Iamia sp.]HXH58871.1 hypothetical protein [Iamia sp.]